MKTYFDRTRAFLSDHRSESIIAIACLIIIGLIVYASAHHKQEFVSTEPGAWLQHVDSINTRDECGQKVVNQLSYLGTETGSETNTFEDHTVAVSTPAQLLYLYVQSSPTAAEFKTKINEALHAHGIDFAGHYTIVDVGMTGYGDNYWIIDRLTGRAYEFPYKAVTLTYKKDSNLLIMDSKLDIMSALSKAADYHEACASIASDGRQLSDLRPLYFEWKGNMLTRLPPTDTEPPVNTFWKQYFKK